jgi:hypothetical protein
LAAVRQKNRFFEKNEKISFFFAKKGGYRLTLFFGYVRLLFTFKKEGLPETGRMR